MDKPRYRYYRRILVSVLVVLAVGLASRFYWLRQERARNERLNSLFRAAIGSGAKQSVVRELARNPGQDVDQLLLKIANNRPGWGGTREAAIQELAKRQAKVAPELARLLQVTEGLDVRLAVAEALQNMSCGDGCIRAVLFYEERLWRGDPTIEDRLADGQSTAYLRSERAAVDSKLNSVLLREKFTTLDVLTSVYGLGSTAPLPFGLHLIDELHIVDAWSGLRRSAWTIQQVMKIGHLTHDEVLERLGRTLHRLGCEPLEYDGTPAPTARGGKRRTFVRGNRDS